MVHVGNKKSAFYSKTHASIIRSLASTTSTISFCLPLHLLLLGQPPFISALLLCKALLLIGLLLATGALAGFLLLVLISVALSMSATL